MTAVITQWYNDRLVIERSRVRLLARLSGGRIFFFMVNFLCWVISVSVPPLLPQKHVKDPGHFAKSAGGKILEHTPYACGFK